MKTLVMFLLGSSLAFGATHKVIVKFDALQDPSVALASFDIQSWRQLGNRPVYKLTINSSMNKTDLLHAIDQQLTTLASEDNQRAPLSTLEGAGLLDSRVIFIVDEIYDTAIYSGDQGSVQSRVIFIVDGSEAEFAPLYTQYHTTEVRAHYAWDYTRGAGQTVAVVDTGIDLDHPFLVNNLVQGYDFVDDDTTPDETLDQLDTNSNGVLDEGYGHGTHVAGIIKTIAPGVSLMPIRVADSDGQAELGDIISGIDFAVANGADVINMSMSIGEPSMLLMEAIENARQAGVVVVTSAGNENSDDLMYPSTESEVVTVGSVGPSYAKSSFSNHGRKVDVAAPGERIVSCMPGGGYVARSGTSMAAPIVSGEAAIVLELVPDASVHYLANRITKKTKDISYYNSGYQFPGMADIWDAITVHNQN